MENWSINGSLKIYTSLFYEDIVAIATVTKNEYFSIHHFKIILILLPLQWQSKSNYFNWEKLILNADLKTIVIIIDGHLDP